MSDYNISTTQDQSLRAGGIDPTTGLTIGDAIAKNSANQAYQEELVQQAIEKTKQSRISTQEQEALFDAKSYLSEKGLMPKQQALAELEVVMAAEGKSQDDIDRIMQIAKEGLPETINGQGLYHWLISLRSTFKLAPVIATKEDVARGQMDIAGHPVVEGHSYLVDEMANWRPSGKDVNTTLMEIGAKNKAKSTGENDWKDTGATIDGKPIQVNKQGIYRLGDTSTIGGGPIMPKSSTMATSSTRASAEFAKLILPHLEEMRKLIEEADAKGYIGPAAGRVVGQILAGGVGSTGDKEADKLLGKIRALDTFLKSGAMRVHFGARGGQQMYDHFSNILNTGKQSAALLNGSLDGIESFMQGYANAPGVPKLSTGTVTTPSIPQRRATDSGAAPATTPAATDDGWGIKRKS